MAKSLWLLSGGSGAGKTTFFKLFLRPKGVAFVNADEIAKDIFPEDPKGNRYNAAQIAAKMRADLLIQGRSFCFETVFSHHSKIDFVAKAKALGYCINLVFIHAETQLNIGRVIHRVKEGGHNVPEDKIRTLIPRALKSVAIAAQLSDHFIVFDNSSLERPYQKVLTIKNGVATVHVQNLPDWCSDFV
jgi:predicted ABC-type ATPase